MSAQRWRRWGAAVGAYALASMSWTAAATPLLDDRGRAIASAQAPQRIVSLLPSLTETVCALGACDKLVGTDRYSNWPAEPLRHVAKVGGGLDPHIEAIVALQPDVVLLSHSSKLVQRLETLGLRTVVLEPRTQADVQRVLQAVGQLLHVPPEAGAQRVWRQMQAGIDAAVQSLPAGVAGASVYFEVSRGPFAAGPSSFLGELLTRMGMRNIVPQSMGAFPRLNPEWVVRAQPDVILRGNESMQSADLYPGWDTLAAVREQRICQFDAAASDVLVRPGPRMDEVARLMADCLRRKAPRRGAHD
ncbi:MAG: ABC transporter substrate-binding protein [Comamonas sp.]|nr:ABC transporter substrate-binding protein [Candidatus Comamonas equi]